MKQFRSAFSLAELSIVVLVIGLIIAGVTQGSKLVKKSKLTAAISLTQTSPVKDIDGLIMWFETSLPTSFDAAEALNASTISAWYDNSEQKPNRSNATQSNADNKPKFYSDIFGGILPAIRFDGTNDFLNFDGSSLIGNSYTIFVVEQRRSNKSANYFIGGSSSSSFESLIFGYKTNTAATQDHSSENLDYAVSAYSNPTPRIHIFSFNSSLGKSYFINGQGVSNSTTTPITSFANAAIGRHASSYFDGDLAEIIIFNRVLKFSEMQTTENYLSKKYKIAVVVGGS